ncbi:hypothetical protein KDL44_10100 [bacterium]|nr:hypothetical protein [bacterium]
MRLSVPGKVMLSGEYGVLSGGLAALVPLPRYMLLEQLATQPDGDYPPVIDRGRQYFMNATENHEREHGVPHIAIERSAFDAPDPQGRMLKLGIGSSSAEAAGVLGLRLLCAGQRISGNEAAFLEDVLTLHSRVQDGRGSGADCAVAALGKPLLFSGGGGVSVELMKRGSDTVPLNLLWSGIPADSREFVAKYEFWARNDPEAPAQIRELREAAQYLGRAWFQADPAELFGLIDAHNAVMKEVSKNAGISYFMPVHTQLDAWARRHGGRCKPTGAGGGDMVLMAGELPLEQLPRLCIPLRVDEVFGLTTIASQLDAHADRLEAEAESESVSESETGSEAGSGSGDRGEG